MAKGLAVIKGSNTVVFKALEDGNIVLGQDIAASVVVSGSLKLDLAGAGVDKFLVSDIEGNATWVTIQASQVNTTDGDLQSVLDDHDNRISAEVSRAQSAEGSLADLVGGGVGDLSTALSSEISRAQSAEGSLDSKIATEVANLVDGAPELLDTLNELAAAIGDDANFATTITTSIGSVSTALSTEVSRAQSAEGSLADLVGGGVGDLSTALDNEISRAESAEGSLAGVDASLETRISEEESVRSAADTSLEVRLSTEESQRQAGQVSIDTRISNEESVRAAADSSLETRFVAGDDSLSSAISQEESSRISGDSSLDTKLAAGDASLASLISAEESRAQSVEQSLASALSDGTGDALSSAKSYTDAQVSTLVDGAPSVLDTLNELAAAINDNPSFASDILSAQGSLVTRISSEESNRAAADSSLELRLSAEESAQASAIGAIEDNTITFQGTANEVEIVSGGTVTLGDQSSTVVLGLPDDVTVSNNLAVNGNATLGSDTADLVQINGKMRVTLVDRAVDTAVITAYSNATALANGDFDGHMFYLKGADDASENAVFAQGNKWYFCENGVWHSSFFYVA